MNLANKIYEEITQSNVSTEKLTDLLNGYRENIKNMVMEDTTSDYFIVVWDDGSCNKFTFLEDSIKIEVGEDMMFKPAGQVLS